MVYLIFSHTLKRIVFDLVDESERRQADSNAETTTEVGYLQPSSQVDDRCPRCHHCLQSGSARPLASETAGPSKQQCICPSGNQCICLSPPQCTCPQMPKSVIQTQPAGQECDKGTDGRRGKLFSKIKKFIVGTKS